MHKCVRCGAEFEGKFCGECGTKWDAVINCPHCGTTIAPGAKFCGECGNAIGVVTTKSRSVDSERVAKIVIAVLGIIPHVILALYAVLLPCLYFVSVADIDLSLLGAGIQSAGNVYKLATYLPEISVMLIVFAVIVVAFVAIAVKSVFDSKKDIKYKFLFGISLKRSDAIVWFAPILYVVGIVLSSVAMNGVTALVDAVKVNAVSPIGIGAATKLVLAFSIAFFVLSAAVDVATVLLLRKFDTPVDDRKISVVKDARDAEAMPVVRSEENFGGREISGILYGLKKAKAFLFGKFSRIFEYGGKRSMTACAVAGAKSRRALTWCFVILFVAVCELQVRGRYSLRGLADISPHIDMLLFSLCAAAAVILSLLCPIKWSQDEFIKTAISKKNKAVRGIKRIIFLIPVLFIANVVAFLMANSFNFALFRGYIIATLFCDAAFVLWIIGKIIVSKSNYAIASRLRAVPETANGNRPEAELVGKLSKHRRAYIILSMVFAVTSLCAVMVSQLSTDKFSASYVAAAIRAVPESYFGFREAFGEPYAPPEKTATGDGAANDDSEKANDKILTYYSDNYLAFEQKVLDFEKLCKAAAEAKDVPLSALLSAKKAILAKQASDLTYKTLELDVSLDEGRDEYRKVKSVKLDANCNVKDAKEKKVARALLFDAEGKNSVEVLCDSKQIDMDVCAEMYYTDGSYRYYKTSIGELAQKTGSTIVAETVGLRSIGWKDDWGSYEANINITNTLSGTFSRGIRSLKYTLTREDNGDSFKLECSVGFSRGGMLFSGGSGIWGSIWYQIVNCANKKVKDKDIVDAPWYRYRAQVTDVYLDRSFTDVWCLNEFLLLDFPRPAKITVAADNTYFKSVDGMLFISNDPYNEYPPNYLLYPEAGRVQLTAEKVDPNIPYESNPYSVELSYNHPEHWFAFTPVETGMYEYKITNVGNRDTFGAGLRVDSERFGEYVNGKRQFIKGKTYYLTLALRDPKPTDLIMLDIVFKRMPSA